MVDLVVCLPSIPTVDSTAERWIVACASQAFCNPSATSSFATVIGWRSGMAWSAGETRCLENLRSPSPLEIIFWPSSLLPMGIKPVFGVVSGRVKSRKSFPVGPVCRWCAEGICCSTFHVKDVRIRFAAYSQSWHRLPRCPCTWSHEAGGRRDADDQRGTSGVLKRNVTEYL